MHCKSINKMTVVASLLVSTVLVSACASMGQPKTNGDALSNEQATNAKATTTVDAKPATATPSEPETQVGRPDRIQRHIYAGFGIGKSQLEPDTSEVSAFDVNQSVDTGMQFTLGMDLNRIFSVELHSADLGAAGLSPRGSINYQIHGASVLVYAGKNRHNYKRTGLTAYGRIGLGLLQNSASDDVPYVKDNAAHILFGAGIEYMTRSGFGLRAEGIAYEEDAQYAQLALIYRFGQREEREPEAPTQPIAPVVVEKPKVELPRVVIPKPVPKPKANPCDAFAGVLDGVTFHNNSAKLTVTAKVVLNDVSNVLATCESKQITLSAHTDSSGSAKYNQALSQRRVESVQQYLIKTGINANRIIAKAYGESRPIADNKTADGRRKNRRVELVAK